MSKNYRIKEAIIPHELGSAYVAQAIGEAGNILASVSVEIPVAEGMDLVHYFGKQDAQKMIQEAGRGYLKVIMDHLP